MMEDCHCARWIGFGFTSKWRSDETQKLRLVSFLDCRARRCLLDNGPKAKTSQRCSLGKRRQLLKAGKTQRRERWSQPRRASEATSALPHRLQVARDHLEREVPKGRMGEAHYRDCELLSMHSANLVRNRTRGRTPRRSAAWSSCASGPARMCTTSTLCASRRTRRWTLTMPRWQSTTWRPMRCSA